MREWICSPCARRRAVGGRLKGVDNEARTFEELASRGDREGRSRLAVLYADGANAGAAFQAIDTMARHRTLSEAVEDAFDQAVQGILDQAALQDAGERLLCQKPIRGGDDAVLILPARFAFDAATRIIASVEDTFDRQRNPLLRSAFRDAPPGLISCVDGFGVGVGVVIADCHFPVGFLVRYAEELLRSAKGRMHDDRDSAAGLPRVAKGAVDFLVLASGRPLSESISQLRRTHLRIAPRGREPGLYLTERPYRFDDFQRFLADAKALAAVNRSQLFAVRQEVLRGYAVSRSLWRYQHARAREGASGWAGYRAARGAALDEVDGLLWREARPPAQIGGAWMSTSFLDAIEILGALPEAERSGEAAP